MSSEAPKIVQDFLDEFRVIALAAVRNCKTEEDLRRVNAKIQKVFSWLFSLLYPPDRR